MIFHSLSFIHTLAFNVCLMLFVACSCRKLSGPPLLLIFDNSLSESKCHFPLERIAYYSVLCLIHNIPTSLELISSGAILVPITLIEFQRVHLGFSEIALIHTLMVIQQEVK